MKKIIFVFILLVQVLTCFSGCEMLNEETYNSRKESNKLLSELLDAFANNDAAAIKELLAPDLLNSNADIEDEIEEAMVFFDGIIISYDEIRTPASGERYQEGELVYARIGNALTENIVTDSDTYEMSFSAVVINERKNTQEGIWRIWIGKSDGHYIVIGADDYDL